MKTNPFLLLAALVLITSTAPAATLFSNLGQSQDDAAGMGLLSHRFASEFVTGLDPSTITGLTVRIQNNDTIQHGINAFLYADNGSGGVGSLLATFTAVDHLVGSASTELATFSHAGIGLSASTQYWIAVSLTEAAVLHSVGWVDTSSNAVDGGSIFTNATPPNIHLSTDSGGSWAPSGPLNGQFSLEGTAVPEPSRAVLMFAGLGGMLLRRRRSR